MKKTSIEQIVYGDEPLFDKPEYSQSEFITTLNFYNYNASHDQLKEYTIKYFEDVMPEVVSTLKEIPKTLIPKTLGAICRMLTRGYPNSNYILSKIDTLLKDLLASTYEKELLKPLVEKKPAKVINKTDNVIADIDGYLDFSITSQTFPKKNWEKTATASSLTKKEKLIVSSYYQDLLMQLNASEDEYNLSKQNFEKYKATVQSIIEAFTVTTERKPRVIKPVDLNKLVSKVKYLKDCPDLGLTSINPVEIIGAKYVLLFNVKDRKLRLVIAEDKLTVRGSTIYGINKDISISKMVKFPLIIQNKFLSEIADIPYILGSFRLLKTKSNIPSGAINQHTLILKVF